MYVRWDEVVSRDRMRTAVASDPPQTAKMPRAGGDTRVHVKLFGALAAQTVDRSLDLVLPVPATVGDVVAVLGGSLGDEFVARVIDEKTRRKHRYCRLYVAGRAVEDLNTPLAADATDIEMILLVAPEGG